MTVLDGAMPPPFAPARTFFGEPRALAYLAFTEAWERFSYYGMTSLLVLYMSEALFLPGHIEHIAGFAAFRAGLQSVFGPMSTLALASQVYGLYTGLVYFTPIFGGLIADRLIGRRRAVMLGAVLMSGGHIAMAFDTSFLLALVLLIVGCGLLKGNISTQVGQLYPENDAVGRSRGFSIFSMGINVGAVTGPLVCGFLGTRYGWHWGFGLAGVLMLTGLATYIAGYRLLSETSVRHAAERKQALTGAQLRVIAVLFAVMALTIFQSVAFYQNANIGLIWIKAKVDLNLFGFAIPPHSAALVRRGRFLHQHRRGAGAVRAVALAERARRRAGRACQDLDRGFHHGGGEFDAGAGQHSGCACLRAVPGAV
jgi:proton-dependent oligopeptide transporter, POT family